MIKNVLILDNFDSFTYNLVDYFKQLNCSVVVYRNTVNPDLIKEDFDLLVLSPGPSIPKNAGYMMDWIKKYYYEKPIFGVCLGHQALIEFFGGKLKFLEPAHGKSHEIEIDQRSIYNGLPNKINVGRYHSLAAEIIPDCFEISGKTSEGIIMSIRHKTLPIEGVQYHPESILSMNFGAGMKIIKNITEGKLNNGNFALTKILNDLKSDKKLENQDFINVLKKLNEGELTNNQILMLLISLSYGLNNPDSLFAFVNAIKTFQNNIDINIPDNFIDICGTGGSQLPRINTSTISAFLLASAGLTILKHGNKTVSGRFGSFDLIEKLGIDFNKINFNKSIEKTNLALLFAPNFHPIFKKFANARKEYPVSTIFNILGPFMNPFSPKRQLIGTAHKEYIPLMIELGKKMNYNHLIIVSGNDGLDEITLSDRTFIAELKDGKLKEYYINPEDFGIDKVPLADFCSKNNEENVIIAQEIIQGKSQTKHKELIAINSAFVYSKFYDQSKTLKESFDLMMDLIKQSKINELIENYKNSI